MLLIILLSITIIVCYYYAKQKGINGLTIWNGKRWILKVRIKNRTCYYFDDIIKLEDFDLDNILIDEKSYENILIMTFHIRF